MGLALPAPARAYLIPVLGVAAMGAGVGDVGRGIRVILAYSHAANPVPLTSQFVTGVALVVIGVGSLAIGYRALRHPAVVPLTMLSLLIAFLAWQIVLSAVAFVLHPPLYLGEPVTGATRLFAGVSIVTLIGTYFLYRALGRWLQDHRRALEHPADPTVIQYRE